MPRRTARSVARSTTGTAIVMAVMITRTPTRWRPTAPAAALQLPATRPLMPDRGGIDIAGPFTQPMTLAPHMAMTIPVPETRCPHIAMTRRRHGLGTGRRRRADIDVDRHLGLRHRQHSSAGCKREQGGEYCFFNHINHQKTEGSDKTSARRRSSGAALAMALTVALPHAPLAFLNMLLMPRTAWRMRDSFSIRAKRTYSSPYSPKPIPGETQTLACSSRMRENSSEPNWR